MIGTAAHSDALSDYGSIDFSNVQGVHKYLIESPSQYDMGPKSESYRIMDVRKLCRVVLF